MDTTPIIDTENLEEQKKKIEAQQQAQAESIVEVDEAAGAAEGMTDRDDAIGHDVEEDRNAIPPEGIELPA